MPAACPHPTARNIAKPLPCPEEKRYRQHDRLHLAARRELGAYQEEVDATRARQLWTEALAIFEAVDDPYADELRQWLAELEA